MWYTRRVPPANGEPPMSDIPPSEQNQSLPSFDFDRPDAPTLPPSPALGQEPVTPQFSKPKKKQKGKTVGCFGILLGFGLFVGGCIAFVGLQANSNIGDVRESGQAFLAVAQAGDTTEAQALSFRGADCMADAERDAVVQLLDGAVEGELGGIDVVTVSGDGDSSFGWGDVEQLRLDFPQQSVARASGTVVFSNLTSRDVTLILLRPASQWRVCQVTVG